MVLDVAKHVITGMLLTCALTAAGSISLKHPIGSWQQGKKTRCFDTANQGDHSRHAAHLCSVSSWIDLPEKVP